MKTFPAPAASSSVPPSRPSSPGAPRFLRGAKIPPPVVASNGDFIRAWAARRAKLARTPRSPRT